jgi:hypothetical protein
LKLSRYAVMSFSYRLCLTWRRVKFWLIFVGREVSSGDSVSRKKYFFCARPSIGLLLGLRGRCAMMIFLVLNHAARDQLCRLLAAEARASITHEPFWSVHRVKMPAYGGLSIRIIFPTYSVAVILYEYGSGLLSPLVCNPSGSTSVILATMSVLSPGLLNTIMSSTFNSEKGTCS